LRSGKSDQKGADKGSFQIIWITIGIANTFGLLAAIFLELPISQTLLVPFLGLALIVMGMIIRFVAIWTLGRFFTVDVTIRENHTIKQSGLYKIIRHPSYLGSLLSFIGYGLSLNNWVSLILISVLMTWAMLHRIAIEEKVMVKQFGEEYISYMKHSRRLIPWIY